MKKLQKIFICLLAVLLPSLSASALNKHILVGYWHNFNNGAANGLKLSQVSNSWDVINLSFAEPTSSTSGELVYNPIADNIYASADEFKKDVKAVQAKGKKVLLSIGGVNGQVRLETQTARDNFIRTAKNIITTYGLDGLDIDFEGHSLSFNAGDYNISNPTTPVIVNLIYALKEICNYYGDDFLLTFAPETFFVQQGYSYYGSVCYGCDSRAGAYLPVLYAMKDRLSWLQVQYYNSGTIPSPEGSNSCGSESFVVNLVNMLATGFSIADPQNLLTGPKSFPALHQDQIVIGVPSTTGSAGSGVLTTNQYISIFNTLLNKGYTNLRGYMTWSINWDKHYNYEWSAPLRTYFDGLLGGTITTGENEEEEKEEENGGNTGTADCSGIEQWNSSKAYNVYGEYAGKEVAYEGNVYTVVPGTWSPAGVTPNSTTYVGLWTLVRACGSGSGNNDNPGDITNDRVLTQCLKKHLVIGYWHNFNNGASNGLKLADVNTGYDFLNVSFGETDATDRALVTFALDNSIYANDAAFINDIKTCQARGQKVNLSLGGQNGIISVSSENDKNKFVNSVIAIIEKYGFDGLDIDFEGTSAGGTSSSFINPGNNALLMISAIREICNHFGDNFILTMAPETAYVQFGINQGTAPAYLALIYGLRDKLTVLHVQLYNTGSSNDLYGNNANPGTADYLVAMCDMMLQGFPCCGTTFPALDEDQVAIGIPACTGAAGSGIVSMDEAKKAVKYLITGVKSSGMNYTLKKSSGYPNFRGVMTWSVNWDAKNNYSLANTFNSYFTEIGNPLQNCDDVEADIEKPSTPSNLNGTSSQTSISLSWNASSDNVKVNGYNIYVNGSKVTSTGSTSYTISNLSANTLYTIAVEAYDNSGNKSAQSSIQVTTLNGDSTGDDGDTGIGTCTDPEWNPTMNYQQPGIRVSHNGKIYDCLVWWTTAGSAPDTNTAQWEYKGICGASGDNGNTGGDPNNSNPDTGIDYENGKKFVVYFPNWGTYNAAHLNVTVGMIPWEKVTHINHAFYMVGNDYKLVTTDEFADLQKSFDHSEGWDKVDRLAGHLGEYKYYKSIYPSVKVLISVGGWTKGQNFHAMALTKEGRNTFISSVIAFLKQYPFIDGIDIDWEYPGVNRAADSNDSADKGCPGGPEDAANYVLLLKELREAYNSNGLTNKLLTIAATINQNTIAQGANPKDYEQYLDIINLMSYDAHGAFDRVTNHHAAIYPNPSDPSATKLERETFNAQAAGAYYASCGVPKSKITIGSPWYSRGWGGVSAGNKGDGLFQTATGYLRGTWDDTSTPTPGGQFPWFEVKKLESTTGWTKYYDNISQVPYLFNASTGSFLTYEDEQSLEARCNFIKDNNYGGIIVWEISGDDLNNGAPLTSIVYRELYQKSMTTDIINNKNLAESNISIYPNPTTDYAELSGTTEGTAIYVFNMVGRLIKICNNKGNSTIIDVTDLNEGLYIIKAGDKSIKLQVK
ncbi:MAG: T9SS type A sorting domain-containing protein [Bacteroidia bacterium]|nr:T9SS type A sorting domain-containing protein [Bacteroidia bacterium]